MPSDILSPVVEAWLSKINSALEFKRKNFQDDADELMKYFNGPYNFLYDKAGSVSQSFGWDGDQDQAAPPMPSFRMTLNRVAELEHLFVPVLYHRNPYRQVNPRRLPLPSPEVLGAMGDPMMMQMFMAIEQQTMQARAVDQARASLLQEYLNYTPNELNLKRNIRLSTSEALIKGAGVLWTELYTPKHGNRMVGSFHDSIDFLALDHDVEQQEDIQWCARLCVHPVWEVEREYQLPPGTIKGNLESLNSQYGSINNKLQEYARSKGLSNDLIAYWKVYSKMGMGARLAGVEDTVAQTLEVLGDNIYLVIAPGHDYPLNLPLDRAISDQEFAQRVQWPVPFWRDGAWPFTLIYFHSIPRKVWPMAHLKPALGELQFLNWAYSYLATKIATSSRDFIAVAQALNQEIKDKLLSGKNFCLLEVAESTGKSVSDLVAFIQHPPMNKDIWDVIQAVEANFERRTGLNELMYAQSSRQMRSAQEAALRGEQMRVRPDDMAQSVEESLTDLARKEALATRWFITGKEVEPIMGPFGAQLWDQLVTSVDPATVMEYEFRVEASGARKPNKDRDAANMQDAMRTLGPILSQWATGTGQVDPFNQLLTDWSNSIDLVNGEKYRLTTPPPPPMMEPAPGTGTPAGPPPEEQVPV